MGVAPGFSYGAERLPPPASPGCTCEVPGPAAATPRRLPPSAPPRGCVLFHINDKERSGSKKSLSYTHLFKKSHPHNTVGRSPQESSESRRGMSQWQKAEATSLLFTPRNRGYRVSEHRSSFTKNPRPASCISMVERSHTEKEAQLCRAVTFLLLRL